MTADYVVVMVRVEFRSGLVGVASLRGEREGSKGDQE